MTTAEDVGVWWLISLVCGVACWAHLPSPWETPKGRTNYGPVFMCDQGGLAHANEFWSLLALKNYWFLSVRLLPKLWLVFLGVWQMDLGGGKQINFLHSPWGRKESDMAEWLFTFTIYIYIYTHTHTHIYIYNLCICIYILFSIYLLQYIIMCWFTGEKSKDT